MSAADALSADAVAAGDPAGMIDDVLAQPHQIGDALWRVEAAGVARQERSLGLVVCGMGGSAIGGDLAAAAIGGRARAPITVVRGYELPAWAGPKRRCTASSRRAAPERDALSSRPAAASRGWRATPVSRSSVSRPACSRAPLSST